MKPHPFARVLPVLLLLLALGMPAVPALAQDAGSVLSVDGPYDGEMAELGKNLLFHGWAGHQAGPGTGIDRVQVLDAPLAAGGIVVAEATYGRTSRADVGAAYGAAWTNSEFQANWMATGSTGNRTFWVYAHSIANDGWTNKTVTVRMSQPMAVQAPAPAAPVATSPQYNSQYGSQYGSQYNQNQYGQYPNQYGNQYGSQNGQYDPYASQYNQNQYGQYGSQNGQYDQYGQYIGNPYGTSQCGMYGASYSTPYYGGSSAPYASNGYGCAGYNQGFGQGFGISGSTVAATAATDGTITLTWAPVPYATQYRVYQLSPSSSLVSTLSQQSGLYSIMSTTLSGLTAGSQYAYQVRAVVTGGSETIAFASWNGSTVAALVAPVTVSVGARTSSSVALAWTPSVTASVTSYQTSQALSSTGPWAPSVVSALSTGGATVGGLSANTTYYFQVAAVAGNTMSTQSVVVSALTTS